MTNAADWVLLPAPNGGIMGVTSSSKRAPLKTGHFDEADQLFADDVREEPSDVPPCDDSEEAQAEWEQVQAEWAATGFPGCEPAFPVAKDQPREVDPGFVIVEPDESFENALKRFKKSCEKAGLMSELRKRQHYEKPSVKRKRKTLAARKKAKKRERFFD